MQHATIDDKYLYSSVSECKKIQMEVQHCGKLN